MVKDLEKVKACPECGGTNIVFKEEEDEIICQDCGCVFSELSPKDEKKFEKASDVI